MFAYRSGKTVNLSYCRLVGLFISFVVLGAPLSAVDDDDSIAPPPAEEERVDPSQLTLQRIFTDNDFKSKSFGPARWPATGGGYTTIEKSDIPDGKDIVRYDPSSNDRRIIIAAASLIPPGRDKPLKIDNYAWSNDGGKLLIFTNTRRVWRKNTRGDYWVYDIESGDLMQLGGQAESSRLMFAKFTPDGKQVAYVYKRNIYIQNLKNMHIKQLTRDGSDTIINGTSDWVNEEEFGLRDGFRISDDGKFIAYWQFDTEGVEEFELINYTDELYPKIKSFKYPKVGQVNSACRVGVVSLRAGGTKWLDVPGDLRNNYIPKMMWVPRQNRLIIQRLNRLQNTNRLMAAEIKSGWFGEAKVSPLTTILVEKDDAWVEIDDDMKWIEEGRCFTWISERDGWRRLYKVSGDGKKISSLTPEKFDVINVVNIDEKGGWVYYIASPDDPARRYLYRTSMEAAGATERLTPDDQVGTHSYQTSKDSQWAIHTCSSFDRPAVIDMVSLPEHKSVRTLEDNAELIEKLAAVKKSPVEFFSIDVGDNVELDGWRIKPPDFDPQKKYPLFIYVYGEPAGQTVMDRWGGEKALWHHMLAQQGYIVVSFDNRGTPAPRGRQWRKSIYRQIGILASTDQAAAVRAVIRDWPYIDSDRIGVWGWSGGGSMTLNAMFRYPELYHTGIAVAFVSNQKYYDTIYQERYMATPEVNEEGLKNGSPITFAQQLEGNLMLVYGTGDDNCHYQNCQALINKLVEHNKRFSMMAYPNRTHGISEGKGTKRHLFEMMTNYLNDNLPAGAR